MAWTRVKNRRVTDHLRCRTCPSWLRHWENGTNRLAVMCGAYGCRNLDLIGAHVIKVDGSDRRSYIVPICTRCNSWQGELEVFWDLLPVGSSDGCRLRP